MDFEFPEDTLMLRDMLRRFVKKEAQPLEMKYFTSGELAPEESARLRKAVEQMGLWGLTVPEGFGGGGLDLVSSCLIDEELGQTFIPVEIGEVPAALFACAGPQVADYLEPALAGERRVVIAAREPGGLRPESWTTTARNSAPIILEGRKVLSHAPGADDFLLVYAQAEPGLTAFLVDASCPGVSIQRNGEVTLALQDCRVGEEAVVGGIGKALEQGSREAPRLWIRTGARYVGAVTRLLEMAAEHARSWVSLGEPLSVRPAIQRMLAEMQVEVESARWLVYHAAWLADARPSESLRIPAAQVRLATGEMLQRAVDRVTMVFLGPGPSPEIEPRRLVRSLAPPEALEFALEGARAVIAAELVAQPPA